MLEGNRWGEGGHGGGSGPRTVQGTAEGAEETGWVHAEGAVSLATIASQLSAGVVAHVYATTEAAATPPSLAAVRRRAGRRGNMRMMGCERTRFADQTWPPKSPTNILGRSFQVRSKRPRVTRQ